MDNCIFRTTDLALAAALKTTLRVNPRVSIKDRFAAFCFEADPQNSKRIAENFYANRLEGDLRRYSEDLRTCKSLIFAARDRNDG